MYIQHINSCPNNLSSLQIIHWMACIIKGQTCTPLMLDWHQPSHCEYVGGTVGAAVPMTMFLKFLKGFSCGKIIVFLLASLW